MQETNDADSDVDVVRYSTSRLAATAGYSAQQVRDLERLDVIPPASRHPNGYREFTTVHATALRAYRQLAIAVGPVIARATSRELRDLSHDEAVATIVALHVGLARSREETLAAIRALDAIANETANEEAPIPEERMSITELSVALGVRASTLRFWEQQGLISPERPDRLRARRYPLGAIRDARIVAALRAGGYGIPAVRAAMAGLRTVNDTNDARAALQDRLHNIAVRSEALLVAGADLAGLLRQEGRQ